MLCHGLFRKSSILSVVYLETTVKYRSRLCHPNVPCAPGILFRTDRALKGLRGCKEFARDQETPLRGKQVLGEYWESGELAHMLVPILFCNYSVIRKGNGPFFDGSLRQCSSLRLYLRGHGDNNQYLCFMSSLVPDLSSENSWKKKLTKFSLDPTHAS